MNCRATDHIVIQNMYKMSSPSPERGPECDEEIKVDAHNPVLAVNSEEEFYSNDEENKRDR
jgi:hypothetical protein